MRLLRAIERRFEEAVAALALVVMASVVMLQVVLRYVFSSAVPWAEEVAVYCLILAVYLGAALAVRERSHIRITLLIRSVPRPVAVALVVLADAIWAGFLVLMVALSVEYVALLFRVTYVSPGLGIEQRWVQWIVPFAFALMLARIGQVYWLWWRSGWKDLPL